MWRRISATTTYTGIMPLTGICLRCVMNKWLRKKCPDLLDQCKLHGVIIRTTGVLSEPTLYKTVGSFSSLLIAAFMALLAAMLGSVLSLFAKKYLIELPTTARYDDLTG